MKLGHDATTPIDHRSKDVEGQDFEVGSASGHYPLAYEHRLLVCTQTAAPDPVGHEGLQ